MNRKIKSILTLLAILIVVSTGFSDESSDPIFKAMNDELERSMNDLVIEGMPQPYFLSYRVQDSESITIQAQCGALSYENRNLERYFYVELRVGEPSFDNTNFIGSWQDVYNPRENLVEEDAYKALRHQIWMHTDKAYKKALENLARKQAHLQANPSGEEIDDFSKVESFEYFDEPISLQVDAQRWEQLVKHAAETFYDFPALQNWKVTYNGSAINKRYINSEGSRHLKSMMFHFIELSATTQAEDGQRLTAFKHYYIMPEEELPTVLKMTDDIRKLAGDLVSMADAPLLEEYAGPVLFTDYAAAQFISQLFVEQLVLTRKPVMVEDWMSRYIPVGKLTGRLNRRVFPDFINVLDEPNRKSWQGIPLAGFCEVDDEGVKSRDITLVKEGRLVEFPLGRQPVKKIEKSNGHARTLPIQMTISGITNLIVESEKAKSHKALIKELRKLSRDFGNEYGLLVTLLDNPSVSSDYSWTDPEMDESSLLNSPVLVFKVYCDNGRIEPVRGLTFDEVSIRSLRDIAAVGKDVKVWNMMQPSIFAQYVYPASIITPSILVEELEFKAGTAQEPHPIGNSPLTVK